MVRGAALEGVGRQNRPRVRSPTPAKHLHPRAVGTVRLVMAEADAAWRAVSRAEQRKANMRGIERTKGREANFHPTLEVLGEAKRHTNVGIYRHASTGEA